MRQMADYLRWWQAVAVAIQKVKGLGFRGEGIGSPGHTAWPEGVPKCSTPAQHIALFAPDTERAQPARLLSCCFLPCLHQIQRGSACQAAIALLRTSCTRLAAGVGTTLL